MQSSNRRTFPSALCKFEVFTTFIRTLHLHIRKPFQLFTRLTTSHFILNTNYYAVRIQDFRTGINLQTGTKYAIKTTNFKWQSHNLINILIYIKNKQIRKMAFLPLSAIVPRLSFLRSDCILYVDFNHEILENGTIKPHLEN